LENTYDAAKKCLVSGRLCGGKIKYWNGVEKHSDEITLP
jgi:hypothetical protein